MVNLFSGFSTYVITVPQRNGQTDGHTDSRTTCRSNTALCVALRGKTTKNKLETRYKNVLRMFVV